MLLQCCYISLPLIYSNITDDENKGVCTYMSGNDATGIKILIENITNRVG